MVELPALRPRDLQRRGPPADPRRRRQAQRRADDGETATVAQRLRRRPHQALGRPQAPRGRSVEVTLPPPADRVAAERGVARWQRVGRPPPTGGSPVIDHHARRTACAPSSTSIFGASSFLQDFLVAEPDVLQLWRKRARKRRWITCSARRPRQPDRTGPAHGRAAPLAAPDRPARGLGRPRGDWPLERVCAALTGFADLAVGLCLDHLLRRPARRGELELADSARPSGGLRHRRARHGQARRRRAQLLERHRPDPALRPRRDAAAGNERARWRSSCGSRDSLQLMSEASADGYIFRTDLRLRPDPGSTPARDVGAGGANYTTRASARTGNGPP